VPSLNVLTIESTLRPSNGMRSPGGSRYSTSNCVRCRCRSANRIHSWVGFESVEFANPRPIVVHEVCPRTCADFENGSLSKSDDSPANFPDRFWISHPADQKGVNGGFNKLKKTREMFWSGRPDLNRGPPAPKAGALPGCATPRHEVLPNYKAVSRV
jgi:hypothetical protein